MPIYEVTKSGLIKPNSIEEYEIGEKFKTDSPIKDATMLNRVRVLSGAGQAEFVNQLAATDEAVEAAEVEAAEEAVIEAVIEVAFDLEDADKEALLAKAKELGIRGAHLFGEKRLRKEIGLLLNK